MKTKIFLANGINFIFKIIAKNPPMAFIVAGCFLAFIGTLSNNSDTMSMAWTAFYSGFILQALWIAMKLFLKRNRDSNDD